MATKRATSVSKWLRIVLPAALVVVWLGLGGVGGPYFGKIDEVSSNDPTTFLPTSAESTKVKNQLEKFQDSNTLPAIVVFESDTALTSEQLAKITDAKSAIQATGIVIGQVAPPIPSDDGKAAFFIVPFDSNSEFADVVATMKTAIDGANTGLNYKATGPAMFIRDLNKAFAGIDGTLLFVALGVVFVILLIVYRSPILPIVTLTGAVMALAASILVVWHLADAGILQLNGQVQGILFILVIGAATDYALLYISRYREELMQHQSVFAASKAAWKASWEPILAAGGTVSLGLLCLLVSDLGSNKALGPVGAIGIVFAVLSALTFLPAALLLIGRSAFWPRRPRYSAVATLSDYRKSHPLWARAGSLVGMHPRRLWIGLTVLLLIASVFVTQLKADGVAQSDLILGESEARDGQAMLDRHFPSGSGSPTYAIVPEADVDAIVPILEKDKGVDTVGIITMDADKSPAPLGRQQADIKSAIAEKVSAQSAASGIPADVLVEKIYPFNGTEPKVIDGKVVLQITLKDAASSVEARETVARLRTAVQKEYPSALFGGVSAIQLDTNKASEHDLRTIIPLILFVITVVLMLLLRSIVAPLVLLFTTVLSFSATLGVSALLFNHAWGFPGGDPAIVIFGFVFLVALGIDYNIFLMTRVREETLKSGVRKGTLKALVVTGGVITSAGIVLASTFAALNVIPILFLAQISFIVAFGVLLDTLIVRSLLVPSLTLQIGKLMWWPSHIWRSGKK